MTCTCNSNRSLRRQPSGRGILARLRPPQPRRRRAVSDKAQTPCISQENSPPVPGQTTGPVQKRDPPSCASKALTALPPIRQKPRRSSQFLLSARAGRAHCWTGTICRAASPTCSHRSEERDVGQSRLGRIKGSGDYGEPGRMVRRQGCTVAGVLT